MNVDMTIFHQTFFEEMGDLLTDLEGQLLRLEETPGEQELLRTIFRCAHSIKGGSATFGFTDIANLTHCLETLLDQVRNGEKPVTRPMIQLLFESMDQLRALLSVARGERTEARDSKHLIARIEEMIAEGGSPSEAKMPVAEEKADAKSKDEIEDPEGHWGIWSQARRYHLRFYPGPDTLRRGVNLALLFRQLAEAGELESVVCDTSRLPALEEMDPETCYLGWEITLQTDWDETRLREIFEFVADDSEIVFQESAAPVSPADSLSETQEAGEDRMVEQPEQTSAQGEGAAESEEKLVTTAGASALASASATASLETHTLRVATEKVDKLINLVGELIINQAMLNEVVSGFNMERMPRLLEAVAQMELASRELQERVMAVRMLPIKHAFGRFPRLVRDLSTASGKRIELKTTGEETELDKTVIEAIADPLTHLVRNSADHGLETPDVRRQAGKPEVGTIELHAFHEGGNIVIEISDDGRGLDRDRIYAKAVERGLLSAADPVPNDEALYNFIFHPGFSTAQKVTVLSGRGVGLDIVRQAVQALGGSVTLSSIPGKGTRFRIRLPLTMAILEGLSLSVGKEVYILPLTSIVESIRPKPGDVRLIAGQTEVAQVRGEILHLLRLYQVFGSTPLFTDPTQALLVIVENDGHKVALLVDALIGQSQVVIKSLETNYRKVDGIAGATILGDGRVALIVDVPGLVRGITSRFDGFSMAA